MTAPFQQETILDYEPLPGPVLTLDDTQVDRAYSLSQAESDRTKQWSIYLTALAVEAFQQWITEQRLTEQWLTDSRPELQLERDRCHIAPPDRPDGTTAAQNLSINGFTLTLLAVPSFPDTVVSVPRSLIDKIDTHFYITIALYEELRQAKIQSFLRWDCLKQHLKQQAPSNLEINRDGSYAIPTKWFNSELDRLLLYLTCAEPETLPK